MALNTYDTFEPQGEFPAVKAEDVEMPDGKRLSDLDLSAGKDGQTPFIGANGNWWIGDTDTGVQAQGETGPQGKQGPQGDPGEAGADGKTPVKGEDYYTDSDKQEMVAAVIAALPTAEGVGF